MKIIQSFWTRPFLQAKKLLVGSRLNGGWPERKYNYYSIALSYHHLRRHYQQMELVTDMVGKEIIIDKLGLAYDQVTLELDTLADYDPGLWALGKIYTYQIQKEPFLHVDNDIYIWKPFDSRVSEAALVAQNRETSTAHYTETFADICKYFPYVPDYMKVMKDEPYIPCVNAGILGGQNIPFYQQYTEEVFDFVDRNHDYILENMEQFNSACVNVVFEQVIFYALSKAAGIDISYMFPSSKNNPNGIGFLHEKHLHNGYTHALGYYKNMRMVYTMVEHELREHHRESYDKINYLLSVLEL
ncbi:DUF6734 family protein [Chitinophaga sp. 212800010-3]|uniref:DUF6734 family protein n=1 Tax=unclassified Chitinophaga TaxID=2619133 RepID=UPI002DF60D0E|nr:DUF6734 domain-containing protein [Chitinophaga sp. 212800010-3]